MERFWTKVDKSAECWEWTACRAFRPATKRVPQRPSYGLFSFDGRLQPAHRVSWVLTNGPIPNGQLVLHVCDNQGCVRPDHLYLGTHADNTRDAVNRRRMTSGENIWSAKLTEDDVDLIRRLAKRGFVTENIGRLFGVSGRTVRYIRAGEHWRNH